MKKYTHAWLAFKAIERLKAATITQSYRSYADSLIDWFSDNRDGVIQGAWYPDAVIKDMASSHVLKFTPSGPTPGKFGYLPTAYEFYRLGKKSLLKQRSYTIDPKTNLPDRCEAIAQAVIDNLKMQEMELKGSAIAPTDNHVATLLFMLSHYIADAHMPLHCDSRPFSDGWNLHARMEELWDDEIKKFYDIDFNNERFYYDPAGFLLFKADSGTDYESSFLHEVDRRLSERQFSVGWGRDNGNVWDFMNALCHYSYLLSYEFIPEGLSVADVTPDNWDSLPNRKISFHELSVAAFMDAIDSIARIWLRIWRKYMIWERGRNKE